MRAQALADDGLLFEARRGVDAKEHGFEQTMATIGSDVPPGSLACPDSGRSRLRVQGSPHGDISLDRTGYAGMSNSELRRQVGYKPIKGPAEAKPTSCGPERTYGAFGALPEEERIRAVEMGTLIGLSKASQCVLSL